MINNITDIDWKTFAVFQIMNKEYKIKFSLKNSLEYSSRAYRYSKDATDDKDDLIELVKSNKLIYKNMNDTTLNFNTSSVNLNNSSNKIIEFKLNPFSIFTHIGKKKRNNNDT